jgi:hypothetical protein
MPRHTRRGRRDDRQPSLGLPPVPRGPEPWRTYDHTHSSATTTLQRKGAHATPSSALNSLHQAAPASRTGRYAVGPDGPIPDPDASAWRAQQRAGGEKKNENQPLDTAPLLQG